ncbi:MAG: Mce protein [Mycolicibacterium fortuitum]|uniref:Mce protein n=1 Tax=Mycolicibacterium fortuitum TaxID=1766 RepID=UPI0022BA4FD5|nr:Mce protein [Mycolicibacterium fortuitum]WAY19736.1 Mce protein [Mycolicibacterium fortuitum]
MAVDDDSAATELNPPTAPAEQSRSDVGGSSIRAAMVVGAITVVALAGVAGWLGLRAYDSRQTAEQQNLLLQVGKQGAINLTTIDYQRAEADVQRILDSATGTFYDDFSRRSQPFIEVVKKAQAKSVGTVIDAGIESETDDEAQVLVAIGVKTTNAGAAEPEPRSWRMRITVSRLGEGPKVSNVAFVP